MFEGTWFEPGETKEVDTDISEDEHSYYFKLEDDTASQTADASTEEVEEVEDEKDDEDDEEVSKSEEKNNNVGD